MKINQTGRQFISTIETLFDWQKLLREFVECESPSHDKALVDAFGTFAAAEFENRGGNVDYTRSKDGIDEWRMSR